MTEIVQSCPLCGSKANSLFDQRQFRGFPVYNLICRHCGLIYQSPRMSDVERQSFYGEGYRSLYQGQENPQPEDLKVQSARAEVIVNFIGDQVKSAKRILDIGCSAGILLKSLQDHYRAECIGVEPGKMYREYARESGLVVIPSLEDLRMASQERFDLISMMHVLEHLPDPLGYIQNLRLTLLKPDGWLLLEVPNLYAHDCFEVAHLISYSYHTLTQLLHQSGFEVLKHRAHGLPRSPIIPLYLTVLAQRLPDASHPGPIQREMGVALKRKLGIFGRRLTERLLPRYAWL